MRIGIDASMLSTNLASSHARVTRLVMAALERSADAGLVALHPTGAVEATGRIDEVAAKLSLHHRPLGKLQTIRWTQAGLLQQARAQRVDLLHCVYHEVPLLAPRAMRVTAMIHDLCGLRADSGYRPFRRAWSFHAWRLWAGSLRADGTMHVSEATRRVYQDAFPRTARRPAVVTPWFVDAPASTSAPAHRPELDEHLRTSPFVAFAYAAGPRKGTDLLATAYRHYREAGGTSRLNLMLSSGMTTASAEALFADTRAHVAFFERVDDVERDALLAASRALLFPSRCEGFGLPLLEALTLGVWPIAFTDTPADEILARPEKLASWGDAKGFAQRMLETDAAWAASSVEDLANERTLARRRAATFNRARFDAAVNKLVRAVAASRPDGRPVPRS